MKDIVPLSMDAEILIIDILFKLNRKEHIHFYYGWDD